MTVQPISQRGRKAKLGNVCFSDGRLAFFAGYCECKCGVTGKILISIDDARLLAQKFGGRSESVPLGARIARRLMRHYEISV